MYGKKRGHRRTGSRAWGSLGEALFDGFFLLTGSALLALLLAILVVPEWRVNHSYVETEGKVVEKFVASDSTSEGTVYRPQIKVRYEASGRKFEKWAYDVHFGTGREYSSGREEKQAVIDRFEIGKTYPIWYDPVDPERVVLVRGYAWWFWLLLLLPVAFILIGGVRLGLTLYHWGKSDEHKAATSHLARQLDLLNETHGQPQFPTVPQVANATNSPGTRLRFRLPINTSQGWRLFTLLALCLGWNAIVAVFVTLAIGSYLRGQPWWLLALFIGPFAAAGLALIYLFIRELLTATGVGPTQVEISDHPLRPGMACQVLISQGGRLAMQSLLVQLVCEEIAVYRQGTDTRTEQRRVFEQPILQRENFEIPPGLSFEQSAQIEIPPDSMHSFRSDHNEVQWKLVVHGQISGWPDFERSFPLIVYPSALSKP